MNWYWRVFIGLMLLGALVLAWYVASYDINLDVALHGGME